MTSTTDRDLWTEPFDATTSHLCWAEVAEENGWRESKARVCPRVVLGGRCLVSGWKSREQPFRCLCCRWYTQYGTGILGHERMWLDRDGRHVLTYEPYATYTDGVDDGFRNDERLNRFRADCAALGLTVAVGDRSPHYPGWTSLLIISKAAPSHDSESEPR